jgi:hypothetical protein
MPTHPKQNSGKTEDFNESEQWISEIEKTKIPCDV